MMIGHGIEPASGLTIPGAWANQSFVLMKLLEYIQAGVNQLYIGSQKAEVNAPITSSASVFSRPRRLRSCTAFQMNPAIATTTSSSARRAANQDAVPASRNAIT